MIDGGARPRLASKARVRHDKLSGRSLLLYPEKGLALNETAAEILALCDGQTTVAQIIERLTEKYGAEKRAAVDAEVRAFLQSLADRNLLRGIE